MPLQVNSLKDNLKEIIDYRTSPKNYADAAIIWSDAYDDYAKNAVAAATVPKLNKQLISSSIISSTQDFYGGFSLGIVSYWSTSIWAGPGLTGVVPVAVNPRSLFVTLSSDLLNDVSVSSAADKISNLLHSYTTSLLVLITNVSSGATTTVKIS